MTDVGHPFLSKTKTFPPVICSGVLAIPNAAQKPCPTSKMFILHILNIHPTCSPYRGKPSSGANPQGKLIPGSSPHLLPPNQSHSPGSSLGTYPNMQLSLQGAMPCHLAPDGPVQGGRASMCNLSLSTLMGCGTRHF